jgi:hypothetical protein
VTLELTPPEFELARSGSRMLEDSFGHEEVCELEAVQALLGKMARPAGQSGSAGADEPAR